MPEPSDEPFPPSDAASAPPARVAAAAGRKELGEYVEQVLDVVESIPPGRVMSYGMVSEVVRERTGSGSARTVGAVMAHYGEAVPWHRVVAADGRLPPGHENEATRRLRAEGVPFRGVKVAIGDARWWPGEG